MAPSKDSFETRLVGYFRYILELKTSAGWLCLFGALSFIPFLINTSALSIGHNNGADWNGNKNTFPPVVQIIGTITGFTYGTVAIITGAWQLLGTLGSHGHITSLVAFFVTLGAWWTFFAGTVAPMIFAITKFKEDGTGSGQGFIPGPFGPTESQVDSVGTLGLLNMTAYAASLIGGLTFFQWQQYNLQAPGNKESVYTSGYYRGRAIYYGFLTLLAGVTQLALGAYVLDTFDDFMENGKLPAPINAGIVFMHYPQVSILVGLLLMIQGSWTMYRQFMIRETSIHCHAAAAPITKLSDDSKNQAEADDGTAYYAYSLLTYLAALTLQDLLQVCIGTAGVPQVAGIFGVFITGMAIMPVYLDFKARTTPAVIEQGYFNKTRPSAALEMTDSSPLRVV